MDSQMNYLQKYLMNNLQGNNPLFAQLFGNAQKRIGRTTDRNVREIKQQGAQTGFRGVGANKINDAYRTESDTLGQVQGDIGQMEVNDRQAAIRNLLQLEEIDNQPGWFGQLMGKLLSGGTQVATAGMMSNWGKG